VPEIKNKKIMSQSNLKQLLDNANYLIDNNEVGSFNLRISGGEPLLAFDNFKDILNNLDEDRFKLELNTNATILNDEIIEWIKNNKITPGISLDNIEFQKPFLNNKSSHEEVMKNIDTLIKNDIYMGICSVFDFRNFNNFSSLAKFVCERKDHIGEWSTSISFIDENITDDDFDKIFRLYKEIIDDMVKYNFNIFQAFKCESLKFGNFSYCPAGHYLLSVDSDLNVSPCQALINEISLGKFDKDIIYKMMTLKQNSYYWENTNPEFCNNCRIYEFCNGGCRLQHKNIDILKKRCLLRQRIFKYVKRFM
jgi:radical SAM protein with 4Fe4S-binding SPASM domain